LSGALYKKIRGVRMKQSNELGKSYCVIRNQKKLASVFMTPWVLGFLAFNLYPIISTIYYSFTKYNLFQAPQWVGLKNYITLFES